MGRQLLSADKIGKRLAPHGFQLNLPEAKKNGISFIRPSSVSRLYEHILISAENPVYAEVVISASWRTTCHACVSELDNRFRAMLSGDSEFQTTWISVSAESKDWQRQLIENADAYCVAAAAALSPVLSERLSHVFNVVDRYTTRLGDVFAVLDREFAFFNEADHQERSEAERMAILAHQMYHLDLDDSKLASLVLIRFGDKVEGSEKPFHGRVPHRDVELTRRLILLSDFFQMKRNEFMRSQGQSW
jgi:hypothetical protein